MEKIPAHIPITDRNFITRVWHRFLDALQRMGQRTEDLEILAASGAFVNSVQDLRGILRDIKTEIALIERTPDSERENLALKLLAYSVDSYSGRVRDLERSFENLWRRVESDRNGRGGLSDAVKALELRMADAFRARPGWKYPYPVWEDLNFGGAESARGAAAPDLVAWDGTGPLVAALDGSATTEELHVWREIPHAFKNGTDATAHVHLAPTTTGAGDVKLTLDYAIVNGSTTTTGTLTLTHTMGGTAWEELRVDFGTISGLEWGNQLGLKLSRDPADAADTYGDDVAILTFGVHYEQDAGGSKTMLTK